MECSQYFLTWIKIMYIQLNLNWTTQKGTIYFSVCKELRAVNVFAYLFMRVSIARNVWLLPLIRGRYLVISCISLMCEYCHWNCRFILNVLFGIFMGVPKFTIHWNKKLATLHHWMHHALPYKTHWDVYITFHAPP